MSRRADSIDALRGLTIFAMILCASIGYQSDLPAWMFHCQEPPPDYAFHPEVRGITWVDLVFPFFIFSMGAAFPFALGGRLDRGENIKSVLLGIFKRWIVLVLFAIILGNADKVGCSDIPYVQSGLYRLAVWAALFAALVHPASRWVNLSGWISIAALAAVQHFVLGIPIDPHSNDIIILLLSTVVLTGSIIWLFTRNSLRLRALAWALVIVSKLLGLDFLMYLVIAIPATMVGDMVRKYTLSGIGPQINPAAAWIAFAAIPLQLWGLFTRNVLADGLLTLCLAIALVLLTYKNRSDADSTAWLGLAMLICGILFDPLDGGIAKDYCNISYLLTTGGMATLMHYWFMWRESKSPLSRNLTMTGRNPMIAYTIAWFVICPLLSLTGLQGWFDSLCVGNPMLGLCRGLVITALMATSTCIFTKLNIYWKS